MTSEPGAGASGPELITADQETTAVVRGVVRMSELRGFFDHSFQALPVAISAQDVAIMSPAFAFYHQPPGETADLEVGFITDRAIQPDGDVAAGSIPGGRVARLVHLGGYEGLGASWERLNSWIREQGLTPGQTIWEYYVTEPTPDMDPSELRTELNWSVEDNQG
ncbi:GyrI-like domain-containing protein [Saxibacter everestensis]|uniref:GyrI-like domain-containing protein n=1 Tax=Saxibacter everestensis TaxID=2909229 RepID=A0ABY8QT93_9MICO|nr:GyrI-like domain-containing protein [Brevibacteriaceae bacterium ZFBP1038]